MCQIILVILALFIAPLSVAIATSPCDHSFFVNIALYGGYCLLGGSFFGSGAYNGGSWMGQLLGTLAGLLWLAAFIHAVCVIFPCGGNRYQQRELGKRHGEHGEYGAHPMMPKNLSVQSSYMICDCRGAKGKNGLVKVRVPRGMVRRRDKQKQAQTDKESNGDLSTDSAFELEKTHTRRAMMPYVSRENHEGKRDFSAGESEDSDVEKGRPGSSHRT